MCQWSLREPNQLITFFLLRVLTCPPKQAGSICLEYTTYNHQDLVACMALVHSCAAVAEPYCAILDSYIMVFHAIRANFSQEERHLDEKNTINKE